MGNDPTKKVAPPNGAPKTDAPAVTGAQVKTTEVVDEVLNIPLTVSGFHGKQVDEDQNDSFGGYCRYIRLIYPNKTERFIQKDGKPVPGAVQTKVRQAVKLMLVGGWFVGPGLIKSGGYLNAMAVNLPYLIETCGKLKAKGIQIEMEYGSKGNKVYIEDADTLAAHTASLVAIYASTIKNTKPADAPVVVAADGKPKTIQVEEAL